MNEKSFEPSIEFHPPVTKEAFLEAEFERVSENEIGEPMTWGATPLIVSSPEVIEQQNEVKHSMRELFEDGNVPEYVTPQLAEYIETLNMARTASRESRNMSSYMYRGNVDMEGIPLKVLSTLDRAVHGSASPAELLLIAEVFKVPTIEIASLTHPYGLDGRINLLKPMRRAVNEAIVLMGGSKTYDQQPTYTVKGSDNLHNPCDMQGIHMTRKRMLGVLPDGTTIMERSSFVIDINKLPAAMAEKIRSIPYGENWSRQVRRAEKLYELVPNLLAVDDFETAIPVSTTIVAMNQKLQDELLSDEATRQRRLELLQGQHKSLI